MKPAASAACTGCRAGLIGARPKPIHRPKPIQMFIVQSCHGGANLRQWESRKSKEAAGCWVRVLGLAFTSCCRLLGSTWRWLQCPWGA